MLVGHPTTTRGYRTSVCRWNNFLIYGVTDNLVFNSGKATGNVTYTHHFKHITCVSVYPLNEHSCRVAFGDV